MSRPNISDLLKTARQLLFSELLPALPKELHYQARMIANTMIIAAREQQLGQDVNKLEQTHLQSLLSNSISKLTLQELRICISKAIRQGEFDEKKQLSDTLLKTTQNKLAISNPKAVRN